jgi:hypothetical protein
MFRSTIARAAHDDWVGRREATGLVSFIRNRSGPSRSVAVFLMLAGADG